MIINISPKVLIYAATSLAVPPARVFGVATFYAHFALEPLRNERQPELTRRPGVPMFQSDSSFAPIW